MCLRCQCILILSPKRGPKRDAPHRCSLLRGWFRLFQVPICKILTYTNQSWFQFIAKKKKRSFVKSNSEKNSHSNVQTGHESSGAGTARPSGELCGAATRFWTQRWDDVDRGHRKGGQWVSSRRRRLCWQKPTQTKGGEANESTGRSPSRQKNASSRRHKTPTRYDAEVRATVCVLPLAYVRSAR